MVIKSDNGDPPIRVSLTVGNWLALIGMIVGWTVFVIGAYIKLDNRVTRLEIREEMRQINSNHKTP